MSIEELRTRVRELLAAAGLRDYEYAAIVVHGRSDGPDDVIVVPGQVQTLAPAE
jgi:hypothetical protein